MKKLIVLVCLAFSGIAAAQEGPPPGTPGGRELNAVGTAKQACVDAMNADPTFAKSILDTVDKQIDQKTIDAHQNADYHIQKNQKHVILAYAAMWVIAALFVVFLWRRQQYLKSEIAALRRDLEAASKES
jgi:hypothetical protein